MKHVLFSSILHVYGEFRRLGVFFLRLNTLGLLLAQESDIFGSFSHLKVMSRKKKNVFSPLRPSKLASKSRARAEFEASAA